MFKTKLEVDKHVDNCLKKINNETERNLRSFSFAKLYYNVGDYEHARRYVSSYLNVKPKSAEAYHLLGKCLEKLGKNEEALEAYKNSLQIDAKQNNLILKVCELLSSSDIDMDEAIAKYYYSLAQSIDPYNPAVFSLKERLITTENQDPEQVIHLLLKELEDRPLHVSLRVKLLKHFLKYNRIKEAYKHVNDIEKKNLPIFNHIAWYETVAEVLLKYQTMSQLNWEFWFLSVPVFDRLATLSLDEHTDNVKNKTEYISAVFNFDQMLFKASQNLSGCPDHHLVNEFISHHHAQLYFHIATLIFKQAKKDFLHFKEASNITLPVLLAAYHTSPPDLQSMWFMHLSESTRCLVLRWFTDASYRCSQTGHILLEAAKDRKSLVLDKAAQYSMGTWREQVFKKVFVQREQQLKMSTSHFVSSTQPLEPVIKLPSHEDVMKYDETAQHMYPDSLHHYIWVGLNSNLSDFYVKGFDGLQYSVKNLMNCAAETLNLLDIQAFIYCATLCAKSGLDTNALYYNQDKPRVLPAAITDTLGTVNQSKFIKAAYKVYKNEQGSDSSEVRLSLINGIEAVRCVGHHGLDIKVLVTLATVFEERSRTLTKQSEIEANNARAELYWKTVLPLLEKVKNNQPVIYPNCRLFEYKHRDISIPETLGYIEKGKLFTAVQLMKKKEYERALQIFEHLKDPYASFYQAQIYKLMADQKTNQSKENVTSEMRSQNIILLSKARDCLYLTLDRLREPSVDRSHPLNAQLGTEIEKMERLLSRIDPDNRHECDGMSDENDSDNSVGEHYLSASGYLHQASFQGATPYGLKHDPNLTSTPMKFSITRHEAKPSPERLDAQLRQLISTKDTTLASILEQNKIMANSHKSLLEELRSFKGAVNNLTAMIDDLKTMKRGFEEIKEIKKSVDELKNSVDDLQNVVDVVQEMKKEINELKKDQNKAQLSEEDLYVLDSDYGVDYNINSNINAYTPSLPNVYANYPTTAAAAAAAAARVPNPANLAAAYGTTGLYPGLYPGMAYGYGIGLPQVPPVPQPGALPFVSAEQQVPGLPSVPGSYPGAMMPQPTMNQVLPTTSLGVGLLTGQALTQGLTAPQASRAVVTSVSASTSREPPVNVVITTSDPLPSSKATTTSQPVLSVTIPPHHIKGSVTSSQPHSYQIPMPTSGVTTMVSAPSILSKPPPVISTQSLLSNVSPPLFSAVSQIKSGTKDVTLGLQIEKTLNKTFSPDKNTSIKSSTSVTSLDEHDPCPDFKPIIPLPDEVPVNTGEENETEMFCERAKLYRLVVTDGVEEWKERGIGLLKILRHNESGKIRILMRREQVHKICANHFLTKDMTLLPVPKLDRVFLWAAHDYADEVMNVEKFRVRFNKVEEAKKFQTAFEEAKKLLSKGSTTGVSSGAHKKGPFKAQNAAVVEVKKTDTSVKPVSTTQSPTLGGFVFSSTPTFKPKEQTSSGEKTNQFEDTPKTTSHFTMFTFGKTSTPSNDTLKTPTTEAPTFSPLIISQEKSKSSLIDDNSIGNAEDFVPNAEFKPVVALPELVEVVTGEENCEVLFEARAKLFRYDTSGEQEEWKERGVGTIKVLKDDQCVRLLMRRDQVHKVCCNHTVLKNMSFKLYSTNPKAVVWSCQDFSEGILRPETFTARFKSEEQAVAFLQTLQTAKTSLNEDNKVSGKHHKPEPSRPRTTSWGDKFKPAKGSWECKNCYIVNEGSKNTCIACETPKSGTTKKPDECGSVFSFGGSTLTPTSQVSLSELKKGPKPEPKGIDLTTGVPKFTFGAPVAKVDEEKTAAKAEGFGDAFKPKPGSWECNMCLVRNNADTLYCASCDSPMDDAVPKKETTSSIKGINLDTPGQTFTFGIPKATATTPQSPQVSFSLPLKTDQASNQSSSVFKASGTFAFKSLQPDSGKEGANESNTKFVFGSPQKHDFEFKPRSPRRVSQGQGDEESDGGSVVEEEEDNIYFKPVIPLPDKIDVKTGEEDEDVIFCQRAKLFRFAGDEWKERGLGDIKLLRNKSTGKLRIVMRRDQVLKICLNHWLTKDVEYLPKDEKSWLFHAADFSEGEITREQFCVRFKTADVAKEFKRAVSDAVEGGGDTAAIGKHTTTTSSTISSEDDEIKIISETKVTPEEEEEAIRLGLPPKFLSYRQLPDCTCDQCKKDDEYFKNAKNADLIMSVTPPRGSKSSTSTLFQSVSSTPTSTATSIFGTPNEKSFSSTKTPQDEQSSNLKSLLMKPAVFGTPKEVSEGPPKVESSSAKFTFSFTGQSIPSTRTITGNLFSQPTVTKSGGNIFGGTKSGSLLSASGDIFGGTTTTNLFGTPTTTATLAFTSSSTITPSNLFSSNTTIFSIGTTAVTSATSPFGGSVAPTTSVFGGSTAKTTTSTPLFGGQATTTLFGKNNIFGGATTTASATPIFGGAVASIKTTTAPVFGATSIGSTIGTTTSTTALVSSTTQSIFGAKTNTSTTANLSFGSSALQQGATTNLKEDDEVVLKCDSNISFAALAAKTAPGAEPAFGGKSGGDNSFAFLGAGAPVFGKTSKSDTSNKDTKTSNTSKTLQEGESGDEATNTTADNDDNYDPHYEPIVPLPDQIVVTTGEEDEIPLFNERARLYRFDTNTSEWKERGIGQMKVLHHPQNDTYRLLLRREQVHKIVLNQLIVPSLELQPMVTSDKAWMWAGYNYVENENMLEQLAVRFKSVELAKQFYDVVSDVKGKCHKPADTHHSVDVSSDDQNDTLESPNDDNNEYEDEEYDEDDRSVMFMKNCALSEQLPNNTWQEVCKIGELQVYYDPELYAAKISVNDESGIPVSNTLIGINTLMDIHGKECIWKAVEWACNHFNWRTLKATFDSEEAAQEFHSNYLEGLNYAQQVGLVDDIPQEQDAEAED